jgi:indole-3-glycerol phosphate synthase
MNILDKIVTTKWEEIAALKASAPDLIKPPAPLPRHRRFLSALTQPQLGIIAEVKKASPSKGIIRKDFDPVALAIEFEAAGAAALSILTDAQYFQGHPRFLAAIRHAVALPLLRKEFIVDSIQIWEAARLGADAILLIKAILSNDTCQRLMDDAHYAGLDVLLEIHNDAELHDALQLRDHDLIGINNRNLSTFETDIQLAPRLNAQIQSTRPTLPVVAESGYRHLSELAQLATDGFAAVLIGEGLARNTELAKNLGKLSII